MANKKVKKTPPKKTQPAKSTSKQQHSKEVYQATPVRRNIFSTRSTFPGSWHTVAGMFAILTLLTALLYSSDLNLGFFDAFFLSNLDVRLDERRKLRVRLKFLEVRLREVRPGYLFILPFPNFKLDALFIGAGEKDFPDHRLAVQQLVRISRAKLNRGAISSACKIRGLIKSVAGQGTLPPSDKERWHDRPGRARPAL